MITYKKIYDQGYDVWYDIEEHPKKYHGYICLIDGLRDKSKIRRFYYNGKLHRKCKPSIEFLDEKEFSYHENGKLHRIDGPAKVVKCLDENGKSTWFNFFYIEGKNIEEENFYEEVRKYKLRIFLWFFIKNFMILMDLYRP